MAGLTSDEIAKTVQPSNLRNWVPSLAVMPTAELAGQALTVRNIRYCNYLSEQDYIVRYYDKTFDLNRLQSVDFLVVPFKDVPSLAHTMLSFGFGEQGYLVVSVEVRLEEDESYSPLKGGLRQYELMYVVADERDVIPLRTKYRDVDVYLYPTRATPDQTRWLLLDMLARANKLAVQPEFYDTFSNNCTTNIVVPHQSAVSRSRAAEYRRPAAGLFRPSGLRSGPVGDRRIVRADQAKRPDHPRGQPLPRRSGLLPEDPPALSGWRVPGTGRQAVGRADGERGGVSPAVIR